MKIKFWPEKQQFAKIKTIKHRPAYYKKPSIYFFCIWQQQKVNHLLSLKKSDFCRMHRSEPNPGFRLLWQHYPLLRGCETVPERTLLHTRM